RRPGARPSSASSARNARCARTWSARMERAASGIERASCANTGAAAAGAMSNAIATALPIRERARRRMVRHPQTKQRVLSTSVRRYPLGRGAELRQAARVRLVLRQLLRYLGIVRSEKPAIVLARCCTVARDHCGFTRYREAEQVRAAHGQDALRGLTCRGGIARYDVHYGKVVQAVRIEWCRHAVGVDRHGGESARFHSVAALGRRHDAIEKAVGLLARCPGERRRRTGRNAPALAERCCRAQVAVIGK